MPCFRAFQQNSLPLQRWHNHLLYFFHFSLYLSRIRMDLYGFSYLVATLSLTGVASLFFRGIGAFTDGFDWKNNRQGERNSDATICN